jgi:hypothetical protein
MRYIPPSRKSSARLPSSPHALAACQIHHHRLQGGNHIARELLHHRRRPRAGNDIGLVLRRIPGGCSGSVHRRSL